MKKLIFIILGIFLIEMISASPQISNVFIHPENPTLYEEVKICADVIDGSGINIVRINLRREEPLWNWGLVMDEEDNKYCKTLSPNLMRVWEISEDKTVSYYISARNELGETATTETFYFTYDESPVSFCGDGTCDEDENCSTCSQDCGECETTPQNQTQPITSRKSHSHKKSQIEFCEVNWKCSGWGGCKGGLMTRQCYDENYCDYSYNKPVEETGCNVLSKVLVKEDKNNSVFIVFGIITSLILITTLIIIKSRKH